MLRKYIRTYKKVCTKTGCIRLFVFSYNNKNKTWECEKYQGRKYWKYQYIFVCVL